MIVCPILMLLLYTTFECLILSFRIVLYVVCFLLGNSPASEFWKPAFRSPLPVPSSRAVGWRIFIHLPLKMEPIEGSETSAFRTQTPGNYPKENILQHSNYALIMDHLKLWSIFSHDDRKVLQARESTRCGPQKIKHLSLNKILLLSVLGIYLY